MSMKSIWNIGIVWKATTSENYVDAIGWPKSRKYPMYMLFCQKKFHHFFFNVQNSVSPTTLIAFPSFISQWKDANTIEHWVWHTLIEKVNQATFFVLSFHRLPKQNGNDWKTHSWFGFMRCNDKILDYNEKKIFFFCCRTHLCEFPWNHANKSIKKRENFNRFLFPSFFSRQVDIWAEWEIKLPKEHFQIAMKCWKANINQVGVSREPKFPT